MNTVSLRTVVQYLCLKAPWTAKICTCNCRPKFNVIAYPYSGEPKVRLKIHQVPRTLIVNKWHKSDNSSKTEMKAVMFFGLSFLGLWKEKDKDSELITTIKRSILLIQKEEHKKAEQMLHVALKLAQEQMNHDAIVYIYDMMANLAYEQHELDKAEKLFVSVMQNLLTKGAAENDNRMIHISLKLAHIYQMKEETRKADQGFNFCMQNLKKKIDEGNADEDTTFLWAMCLDWYARFLMEQKRFEEALSYFEKAYNLSLQMNGLEHEETVMLLNDLGTVCFETDDVDGALNYLTKAYEIGNKLPNMEDFAAVLVNLGNVYMNKGMYQEAKLLYDSAWKNAKKHNNLDALKEINACLDELKVKYAAF